jgi:rhomboid protease GluP
VRASGAAPPFPYTGSAGTVSAVTEPAVEQVCYRHPDRPTGLSCSRCGRPICPSCSIDASVGQRCPECVRDEGTQRVVDARRATARPGFSTAPVTFSIIAAAVAVQVVEFVAPQLWATLFETLAMWPPGVRAGEWWRMISVVLLHSGLLHIGFNMLITYQLGPVIERQMGSVPYALLFAGSAAAGSAFAVFLGPDAAGVGASGAVFGLVGAWLAAAVRRRATAWGREMIRQMGGLLLLNAAIPFFVPRVSWQAHLGGLIAGFLVGWVWTLPRVNQSPVLRALTAGAVLLLAVGSTLV